MKFRNSREFFSQRFCRRGLLVLAFLPLSGLTSSVSVDDALTQPAKQTHRLASLAQFHCAQIGKRLVSVGEWGSVLLSDDGGRTLRQAVVDTSVTLTHVHFVTSERGWAVGHAGVVLGTQDGGEHWNRLLDGNVAARLELDAAKVAGNSKRIAEAERLVNDGADKPFLSVLFKNAAVGWALGAYGLFFETKDGGNTWQSAMGKIEAAKGRHVYAILSEKDSLWLVGEQGLGRVHN